MKRYGSDVMVDAIKACGFKYLPLNPGSSYLGLHDSLVNYGGNEPEIITCNHEKLAVGIAHGYTKAAREPMACILHDIVGLLQGTMGIYYAWIDRAPVVVFGGAGPMAYDRRRPNIDWIHTANVQGNAVRAYTKQTHLDPRFHYLIGTRRELQRVWSAWHVTAQDKSLGLVNHIVYTALVDPRGRERLIYDAHVTAQQVLHDLRLLMSRR